MLIPLQFWWAAKGSLAMEANLKNKCTTQSGFFHLVGMRENYLTQQNLQNQCTISLQRYYAGNYHKGDLLSVPVSQLALPSGQRGGSSDLEIGHPGYPDLLSVHFVREALVDLTLEVENKLSTEERVDDTRACESQEAERDLQIQLIINAEPVNIQSPNTQEVLETEASNWVNSHILELSNTYRVAFVGFEKETLALLMRIDERKAALDF
ncbi:hypothetical protein H5410_037016 [Solanum commersonii]|uniref:Uncharacterized protein n=1 Tax=Solanum commersonii TaxID=4109 RepID=A0A9J5Y8A9_SOLCO|nr:hypothetical protein H5410_037016 [Solanum commersonii]